MVKRGIVAGSFDPITQGHAWLISAACGLVDELIVAVGVNPDKKGYFSPEERKALIEETLLNGLWPDAFKKIRIVFLEKDLLINFAASQGVEYIFRGIRNTTDFNYELQMNLVNQRINSQIQLVYLIPPRNLTEVSSSTVRGLVGFNGWEQAVAPYVDAAVLNAFRKKREDAGAGSDTSLTELRAVEFKGTEPITLNSLQEWRVVVLGVGYVGSVFACDREHAREAASKFKVPGLRSQSVMASENVAIYEDDTFHVFLES